MPSTPAGDPSGTIPAPQPTQPPFPTDPPTPVEPPQPVDPPLDPAGPGPVGPGPLGPAPVPTPPAGAARVTTRFGSVRFRS